MIHLRLALPADTADAVIASLAGDPAVSSLARLEGASLRPAGDVVLVDVAREAANEVIERLRELEVGRHGTVQIEDVGARLRGLMPWLAANKLVDKAKN